MPICNYEKKSPAEAGAEESKCCEMPRIMTVRETPQAVGPSAVITITRACLNCDARELREEPIYKKPAKNE